MPDAAVSPQQDRLDEIERTDAQGQRAGRRRRPGHGRLRSAVGPIPRTSGYYARSWREYLARHPQSDLPVVRPTFALARHAFYDELVLASFRLLRPATDAPEAERIEREAVSAIHFAKQAGWLDDPGSYFEAPPPLAAPTLRRVNSRRFGPYTRVSFDSEYAPRAGVPGGPRWAGYAQNRRAWAWMMRHDEPRPWLVCVHGANMGRPAMDLALFRARWMHQKLGLNVAFPILPLHGPRRRDEPRKTMFPGEDVLDNFHGAAQSVWDVRRLLSWIRGQDGDQPVGITGISLGGYVTSLVASVEDGLACAIVGVPVVDLVDLIERHAGAAGLEHAARIARPAKVLGRVISPLSLQPRVPLERRFIYAGLADRMVLPREQVERLWRHWNRPKIAWYEGGHTGFSRSKPVRAFFVEALIQSGLVEPSRDETRSG